MKALVGDSVPSDEPVPSGNEVVLSVPGIGVGDGNSEELLANAEEICLGNTELLCAGE